MVRTFYIVFVLVSITQLELFSQEKNEDLISSLQFFGNTQEKTTNLMPFFELPLRYPSHKFNESLVYLSNFYQRKGYIDFFIEDCKLVYSMYKKQQKMVISLNEGRIYHLKDILFKGNTQFSSEKLKSLLNIRIGDVYNHQAIESEINFLLTFYENEGYPFVTIKPAIIRDTSNANHTARSGTLSLVFKIQEGAFVSISNYQIIGNAHTNDHVFVREAGLYKGDAFNGELFNQIQANIQNLGFFNRVDKPELLIVSDQTPFSGDTLDGIIQINLVEGNPNVFDGIVGYQPGGENTDGFFTGYVNILLKNLFGSGRKLQIEWSKPGKETQDVKLKYMEPWLFNMPLNATFDFEQLKQDSTFSKLFLGAKLSYQLTQRFAVTFLISKETVNSIGNPELDATVGVLNNSTFITGFGLEYDTRDFKQNPKSGLLFKNEYLFGSKTYSASDSLIALYALKRNLSQQFILMDAELYWQTFSRLVLAIGVHGKALISDQIDPGDWFRFGGAQSLRGYREQQFAASQLVYTNVEYRYILSRLAFLFAFLDAGYFYREANPFSSSDKATDDNKTGYGIGARVESPLGLLKVSYALGEGTSFGNGLIHVGLVNEF